MPNEPKDNERFLSLIEAHQRLLLKVCWAYGRTSHERDDLQQEILRGLWQSLRQYDPSRKFSTWMYRVALNVAIDFRRRQTRWGRETTALDVDDVVNANPSKQDPQREEQLQELRALLEQQNPADRAILFLYLEGNSYREIGEILGISETNVGTRLSRLKAALRVSAQGTSQPESEPLPCNSKK